MQKVYAVLVKGENGVTLERIMTNESKARLCAHELRLITGSMVGVVPVVLNEIVSIRLWSSADVTWVRVIDNEEEV